MLQNIKFLTAIFITLVLFLEISQVAASETSILFTQQEGIFVQSPDYNKLISKENLKEGDLLMIGESSFIYKEHLGQGSASLILKVELLGNDNGTEYALRIPLHDGYYDPDQKYPMRKIVDLTIDGYDILKDDNIRIPTIFQSQKETFVLQKLENISTIFPLFMQRPQDIGDEKILQEMEEAFIRFAESTFMFDEIGDFQASQLIYDGLEKEWVLLDWRSHHVRHTFGSSNKTILNSPAFDRSVRVVYLKTGEMLNVFGFPAVWKLTEREINLLERARTAILHKRKKYLKRNSSSKGCKKILNQIVELRNIK